MKYILGVDGGNTKTDYYLFDTDGNFIDMYRGGTCSHEGLKDAFDRVASAILVLIKTVAEVLGLKRRLVLGCGTGNQEILYGFYEGRVV